ncbi:hypothetical protein DACRYDRAFT_104940 [Dacryopinax primogenitus]|uniref:Uncharacterized protein n=1 Tax=Dacryopinax primogenitus (strain DJM 731) TaxID=1858805 RepID=M5GE37_DACPD|nr:uncharacterized protein DACRYDRAFT_104940 [Dacryopinax primogenitus]EJU05052.1 hypothetical protein DACRYDRAFT_104940 [Dacryopinax primogenitus]
MAAYITQIKLPVRYQFGRQTPILTERNIAEAIIIAEPTPLYDFHLENARTRDYLYANKTLRYPYYQTMAHQPMHINDWLEISSQYEHNLQLKKAVIAEHVKGAKVLDSLPENDAACAELLEMAVDYLPKRYPTLFERLLHGEKDGIRNGVTGHVIEWPKAEVPVGIDALRHVSCLTECDFLMAREREDGHVHFTGGLVALPGSYLLSEKIGQRMSEVHGPVPQFNDKLLLSVERTLKRMHPSAPFERSSWAIVDDKNLFWHNIASLPVGAEITRPPAELFLRIDRQTFRKLPRTKAIIFGVHPFLRPMSEPASLPLMPSLLLRVLTESNRAMLEYKSIARFERALIPWLRQAEAEQVRKGLISGTEGVRDFRAYRAS